MKVKLCKGEVEVVECIRGIVRLRFDVSLGSQEGIWSIKYSGEFDLWLSISISDAKQKHCLLTTIPANSALLLPFTFSVIFNNTLPCLTEPECKEQTHLSGKRFDEEIEQVSAISDQDLSWFGKSKKNLFTVNSY